ncbi:MAG: acyl-CoA hydrolase [bacterium]|jgi:acyl-CoA hydrolase
MKAKTPNDSEMYLAEVVGQESLRGKRMSAGALLHMMDLAAATSSWRYVQGHVVTLAFDRVELLNVICHMDYVRYDCKVIKVGRSSLLIKVDGYTKPPTEMDMQPTHSGMITMVAVNKDKTPNRNIAPMVYETEDDLLCKELAQQREHDIEIQKQRVSRINDLDEIQLELLRDVHARKIQLSPKETNLKIRKIFLPKHLNAIGSVFGGEIIELMEELAIANARQFTGNFNMITMVMEDVLFFKPLSLKSLVEMSSNVVFVGKTTLVVEVEVKVLDPFDQEDEYITNRGIFTILNIDRSERKKVITTGLDLTQASLEERKKYLKELEKYELRK